jgi:hypothetical protein
LTSKIWVPTVAGATIGVLSAWINKSHPRSGRAALGGVVGSALGFGVGVAWTSPEFTRDAARCAIRKIHAVSDAHWLEKNPICYG